MTSIGGNGFWDCAIKENDKTVRVCSAKCPAGKSLHSAGASVTVNAKCRNNRGWKFSRYTTREVKHGVDIKQTKLKCV